MQLTAIFDVGLDDQIARTQFPVVSAFAATVHKCQGLTLKNVLISVRSFFAPGMAFVAFSRVTTMNGLHLMDFYEGKVWCDIVSLHKYNSLRATIGLPKYDIPKKKKSNDRSKETTGKARRTPAERRVEEDILSETPANPRRRLRTVDEEEEVMEPQGKRPSISRQPFKTPFKRTRIGAANNDSTASVAGSVSNAPSATSSPEKKKRNSRVSIIKVKYGRNRDINLFNYRTWSQRQLAI